MISINTHFFAFKSIFSQALHYSNSTPFNGFNKITRTRHRHRALRNTFYKILRSINIARESIVFRLSVYNFNLKCLLIEFVITNLSQIYCCIPEIFKTNVTNRLLSTKSLFNYLNCVLFFVKSTYFYLVFIIAVFHKL